MYFTCKAVGRLSKARASLFWLELAHRHPAAVAWQAVVADPVLFGKAGGAMAGLLASHTHTLPAPCTHHFSALPTLKYSSALLPAGRSHQLRGEQGAAARSSWPLRASTCEFWSTCISDGCADLLLGSGVWLAISRYTCCCSGSPDVPTVSYGEAAPDRQIRCRRCAPASTLSEHTAPIAAALVYQWHCVHIRHMVTKVRWLQILEALSC